MSCDLWMCGLRKVHGVGAVMTKTGAARGSGPGDGALLMATNDPRWWSGTE